MRAAIAAAIGGRKTLLISRGSPVLGSATLMSDGFFSSSGPDMSAGEHARLTMETGYHRNKPELVRVLAEEARPRIEELARHGAPFIEGIRGMRVPRRRHATGMGILAALKAWADQAGVTSMGWTTVVDLLIDGARVTGCHALAKGRPLAILARATILCTGGASALFLFHDNPITSLGEGYAIAARAGAALEDMEFIQFYPLVTHVPGRPRALIMPPLTDMGKIINDQGEDLIEKYGLASFRPLGLRARDRLSRVALPGASGRPPGFSRYSRDDRGRLAGPRGRQRPAGVLRDPLPFPCCAGYPSCRQHILPWAAFPSTSTAGRP